MREKRMRAVFLDCLKKGLRSAVFTVIALLLELLIFALYRLRLEPFVYAAGLTALLGVIFFLFRFIRERRRAEARERTISFIAEDRTSLPEAEDLSEEDYQRMIEVLGARIDALTWAHLEAERDMQDYYTAWVHQIKTPIAVMRLKLTEDTEEHRALSAELFRIERYVDMALQYIRLGAGTTDLLVAEYDLNELIRETVRSYASYFVMHRVRLNYEPVNCTVITDKKWFCCVLEQLLSNAVKYSSAGGTVTIRMDEKNGLLVADTGIGIASEDLPRIFEKGYTGGNGRLGKQSSGLGLYLAKKAADALTIPLSVQSAPGEGSTFRMGLENKTAKR